MPSGGPPAPPCDAGGPDPLSLVVQASGIPIAWANGAEHVRDGDERVVDRLAVTKAVTSVRPDHPELEAARSLGIEPESVQQVIADAEAELSGRGRLLIRKSGTEPLIRVMAEGDDPALVTRIVDDICEAVGRVS